MREAIAQTSLPIFEICKTVFSSLEIIISNPCITRLLCLSLDRSVQAPKHQLLQVRLTYPHLVLPHPCPHRVGIVVWCLHQPVVMPFSTAVDASVDSCLQCTLV
jgi:hypothetical protein